MLKEFKKFALRGNVLDLAIGVIIGGAFGTIVSSLVQDVMMPPISVLLSESHVGNFEDRCLPLLPWTDPRFEESRSVRFASEHKIPAINYGKFLNNVMSFLIISFSVFLLVKQINRLAPPVQTNRECPMCCSSISNKAKRCPNCTSEVVPLVA